MSLAEQIIAALARRGLTLATCESVTGGGVGAALTSVPGASRVYRGGLITYARDLKVTLAGLDAERVAHEGVVNASAALQMALGAQRRCFSDWAVSTTGVAGPAEADGAPVGTVWFGLAGPLQEVNLVPQYAEMRIFEGDRSAICQAAIEHCLEMLWRVL